MKLRKFLFNLFITIFILQCIFAAVFAMFVYPGVLRGSGKHDTAVSHSAKKETEVSSSSEQTQASENVPELVPEPWVQEESDPDGDASTGGLSIFETPFADGYEFPDLSGYDFVFIGDSIFDMNYSNTSMPRQLEYYTNSRVYNLSKYGSCAGKNTNGYISITDIVEVMLSGKATAYEENQSINIDVERFSSDSHKGQKMVIVINQCVNDYFLSTKLSNPNDAYDVDTYEGALRTSVSRLKGAYPKATYVFMTPYYVGTSEQGNERNSYGFVMDDYINSMKNIAGEFGARCFELRSYDFFASFREGYLLDDLVHPNDMCSKTMARLFCDFMGTFLMS